MTDERLAIIERTISTTAPMWTEVACAELVAEVKRLREAMESALGELEDAGIRHGAADTIRDALAE